MNHDWLINQKEIIRYLGYKNQEPEERMKREIIGCEARFLQVVHPHSMFEVFDLVRKEERLFTSDMEFEFLGKSIKKHLFGCEQVAFACLTLSDKVDVLIDQAQKEDMLHALIMDAIANAAVEEVRLQLEQTIQKEYPDKRINWLFGIGYGDLPITMQPKFLSKVNAYETIGLTMNDKYILTPLKSVTGFIGIGEQAPSNNCQQRSCSTCAINSNCSYKKVQ